MVRITFPDRETSKKALGLLLGRFSGSVFRSGEQIVPEAAVKFLAERDICFTVKGKVTYEEEMAALRGCCFPSDSTTAAPFQKATGLKLSENN